ncbi:hypothetical protein Acr_10g0008830 [Actinidia rufa]|uniref:Glycosyltransferase 61 catalytic domain-containing protein n=1 Tax=Actinidia rufa TaxID=165716 RepID=A0A7J0F9Y0_9ERIC|nr:hypothetical protein Acr_10g0008830 [Actinidia rufa]
MTNRNPISPTTTYDPKHHQQQQHHHRTFSLYSPKFSLFLLATCVAFFVIFQIQSLQTPPLPPPPLSLSSHPSSWAFIHQWQNFITNTTTRPSTICTAQVAKATATTNDKLRRAVTFLPLKDLRYAQTAQQGHTWFMSSMYDTHVGGEVQYQQFPSEASNGRLLCVKGHDKHDGAWNSYALAWPETLPYNATLMKGLTFVSNNHYNYDNIWHGLSAVVPFVAWHIKKQGGMSRQRRVEVYDLMRCKAREYCNVSLVEGGGRQRVGEIGMTMFMRTGPRSFRNQSAVVDIFQRECRKVEGCQLRVAHSNDLTFCEQVKLMSLTDILVSPHGAQLTNMFLMDRNSSVMEFFPKGWLKLAGVGQYVYHWIASWSGMNHRGAWRDPDGDQCPYGDADRRCMSIYKNGLIGYNKTFFAEWARNVVNDVKVRKMEKASKKSTIVSPSVSGCACRS